MSISILQFYDIFGKYLKLENYIANHCAETLQRTIQNEIDLQHTKLEKQLTDQKHQNNLAYQKLDSKIESLMAEIKALKAINDNESERFKTNFRLNILSWETRFINFLMTITSYVILAASIILLIVTIFSKLHGRTS